MSTRQKIINLISQFDEFTPAQIREKIYIKQNLLSTILCQLQAKGYIQRIGHGQYKNIDAEYRKPLDEKVYELIKDQDAITELDLRQAIRQITGITVTDAQFVKVYISLRNDRRLIREENGLLTIRKQSGEIEI